MNVPDDFDIAAAKVAGQTANADPIDQAAAQVVQGQRTALRSSLYGALLENPDVAARAQKLGRKTGLPADVVGRNLPEVERNAKLNEFDQLLQNSPVVAQWLADQNNAKVAHDDVGNMSEHERLFREALAAGRVAQGRIGETYVRPTDNMRELDRSIVQAFTEPVQRGLAGARGGLNLLFNELGIFKGLQSQRDAARMAAGLAPETPAISAAENLRLTERSEGRFPIPENVSQGMNEISSAQTFGEAFGAAVRNPRAILETTLQSIGSSAPALLMSLTGSVMGPGGTATGAGLGSFAVEYSNTLRETLREKGVDMSNTLSISNALNNPELMAEAREKAVKRGLPVAAFDALTAGLAGRLLAGAKPTVTSVVTRSAGELGLQAGGGAAGEAVAQAATGEYKPGDILMEALAELPSAIVEVPSNYRDSMIRAKSAEQRAQILERLNKLAAASKVRERDVDTFEKFIAQAAENGPVQHVYIDANTLMQSGMGEQLAQVSPSVAAQLPTAIATGGEIQIPVAEYTARIAGSEFAQSLVDDIRVEGEPFTRREAQEYMQNYAGELQAEFERVLAEKQNDEVFKASAETVKSEIKSQLDTVARFAPQVNEANASLVANFYAVMGAKLGATPEEVFAKYPLRVQAEAVQSGPVLEQFAGPKAITADRAALTRAQSMVSEGVSTESVRKSTGWFQGADGMWRFEISDDSARLVAAKGGKGTMLDVINRGGEAAWSERPLWRVLEHPKLFDAYPEAEDIKVVFSPALAGRKVAGYDERQNKIIVSPDIDMGRALPLILHEVQHALQRIEGFAPGTDPSEVGRDAYIRSAGEVEARNTEARISLTDTERLNLPPLVTQDVEPSQVIVTPRAQQLNQSAQSQPLPATIEIDGKQRPTTNSNGQPIAATEEGVRNFWKWFGDSKVVDAEGRPLVVYHGTNAEFTEFRSTNIGTLGPGIYFAFSREAAQEWASRYKGGRVVEAYLRSENPVEIDSTLDAGSLYDRFAPEGSDKEMVLGLRRDGFDAVWAKNAASTPFGDSAPEIAVYDPTQIKSAIGNSGEFDPANPNILMQSGVVDLTEEEFLGSPKITSDRNASDLKPRAYPFLNDAQPEPFLDRYTVKMAPDGAAVFDGDKVIASYNSGDTLVVDKGYRKKGIAQELVYQWRTRYPAPAKATTRTKASQAIQEKVWQRIESERQQLNQTRGANRGSFNPSTNTITLLKNADLSTFLHEAGHFFLEVQFDIASRLAGMRTDGASLSEGEQQIVDDADALLKWFGVESVSEWYSLDFEEKRGYHEKFARGFEAYLFEGKAPSIELNRIFQTFRGWLTQVYRNIVESARQALKAAGEGTSEREVVGKALDVQLSDEVRAVMDRMLATNEEIRLAEQARSMLPLFATPEQAGMTPEEFANYQALGTQATADAIQDVQARTLRDLSWTRNARGREIKRLQKQSAELRREVQMQARREVMSQPIYRAWQFLTAKLDANDKLAPEAARKSDPNVVDPSVDSLFTAIAKLGGLSKGEVVSQWGTDPKDKPASGVFGKPVWRREGGRSIDSMAEALGELGYLPLDENGKTDIRDLEERFDSELRGSPVYSNRYDYGAQQEQRAGDGINVEALGAGRFDLTEIKAMGLPTEVVDRIQSLKMTGKVGLHPDIVAERFGFTSGDELVRTLATTESPKAAIEGLTDARMLEQYGELATPEAIERAADRAIHNEARARFVATEANALAKATGERKILTSAARDFARVMIARLKVRDVRPSQYASAEVRASKAAEKASRSGDLAKAAVEKRNQLVNNYATRAAYDAQDEVERITSFFRDVVARPDDRVGKTRDMDVVNAARAVLSNFGYAGKAKTALEYLEAVKEYDPATYDVLAASVRTAEEMATPDIRDLTVEQLRALHDEVQSLWHLAKRNRQMEVDGDLLDREDVAADINARMVEFGIPDTAPGESSAITPAEKRLLQIKGVRSILRRVESWVDQMDGSNKIGAFRRGVFNPVKLAADKYRAAKIDALRQFRDSFDSIAGTMKRSTIYAPELGYTFGKDEGGVALNEILHAILHTGNESNKRKLLLGRGWAEDVNGVVDTRRWDAFIARMVAEGKLKREHFDFAQSIWDLMESTKPLAQKAHRDAYGKYFSEVTAQEFVDPFGVVRRGGYIPAQVDSRIVQDNDLRKLLEEGKEGMAYAFPATNKGFTQARVEYNRPLMLDLRTLPQHIDKVLLFSYMEMPVRDVTKLLTMKNVRAPLNKIDPTAISHMLMPWLNRSARQQVTTPVPGDAGMSRFFNTLRNRTSMATMFANLSNTAQQITGFSLAAVKVKPRHLLAATAQWISKPRQLARTVAEQSTYMSNRMSSEVDAMLGEIEAVLLDPTMYQRGQEWTKRHTYFMQSAFDNVMGPIIWTGAYNEALEQGYSDKDATHIADGVVRQTQGSTLPEDVSRIETGPAWARIFTQFAGYFNMQANLLGTEFSKVTKEMGLRKGAARGFYIFVAGFYIPALVAEAIAQAFRGGPGDDDDDGEYLDDWLMATLVYGPMRNVTAFVPFVGQVANSAIARFNNNPVDDRVSVAPVVGALEGVAGVPVDLYQASFEEIRAQRTVKDVATLISLTTGLPASVAAKPIGYLVGVASDKIDPTGEFDFARGLVTGVASPESRGR